MRIAAYMLWFVLPASMLAQSSQPSKTLDQLRDLAGQAKSSGDLQGEANYLCTAAEQDAKKYDKKCEKAKADLSRAVEQAHANLNMGRSELQHKDYQGALRDLGKITVGPDHEAAQGLIQQARLESGQMSPEQFSAAVLQQGKEAYARGDFDKAELLLTQVRTPDTQHTASQLLTNINIYRDSMKQAAAMAGSDDYKGAAQKYQFAAMIQPNGPGDPKKHLQDAQDAAAKQDQENARNTPAPVLATAPAPVSVQAAGQLPKTKAASAVKIKALLADAHRREDGGDLQGAMQAYNAALQIDGRQSDALAGKKRVMAAMATDPAALEESLTQGIKEFYASQFAQANDAINVYLQDGGQQFKGAAHFFLGASLLSQAILSDPKNQDAINSLEQRASQEFSLGRQLRYAPPVAAVSSKIITQWMRTGNRQ
ncbi:tetratricopeptide (TPR) repeat protein [Silvibacterium bohemicum]|uniref:Tetratricopeptide (TPR) repeat protein n=1 Tax=Silvibacterium bohemicum TaxID=1577686 RepID=A0A841JPS0_9BACT|nr:hypothetical protein [Silvibacterium bohemicum]MBB6142567.1 tetratricopeptide (TPR) repeat protein [Silvibacterium bohemicum]